MEHTYPDELAYGDSPLHRVDARAKLVAMLIVVVTAALLPARSTWPFAACLGAIACGIAAARLPFFRLLKRTAVIAPFILTAVIFVPFTRRGDGGVSLEIPLFGSSLPVYRAGLLEAKAILLKSFVSALSVLLLISTTRFNLVLKAMERLRVPRAVLLIVSFLYRYLFLLAGEFKQLTRAAYSRNWRTGPWRLRLRAAGGILGSLFLRTYARGERVHAAMLSRGYDGTVTLEDLQPLRARDIALPAAAAAACAALLAASFVQGMNS